MIILDKNVYRVNFKIVDHSNIGQMFTRFSKIKKIFLPTIDNNKISITFIYVSGHNLCHISSLCNYINMWNIHYLNSEYINDLVFFKNPENSIMIGIKNIKSSIDIKI